MIVSRKWHHTSPSAGSRSARWGSAPPAASPAAAARSTPTLERPLHFLLRHFLHPTQGALWGCEEARTSGGCIVGRGFCSVRHKRTRSKSESGRFGEQGLQLRQWWWWNTFNTSRREDVVTDQTTVLVNTGAHTHTQVTLDLAVLGCTLIGIKAETKGES